MQPFIWHPIALLPTVGEGHRAHGLNMIVHAPELVNADANPHGIAEAYWQDDGVSGATIPGAFLAPIYDMCQDVWEAGEITPTHFMFVTAPLDSGCVTSWERQVAEESWERVPTPELALAPPEVEVAPPDAPAPENLLDLGSRVGDIIRKQYFRYTRNDRLAFETGQAVLEEVTRTYEQIAQRAEPGSLM